MALAGLWFGAWTGLAWLVFARKGLCNSCGTGKGSYESHFMFTESRFSSVGAQRTGCTQASYKPGFLESPWYGSYAYVDSGAVLLYYLLTHVRDVGPRHRSTLRIISRSRAVGLLHLLPQGPGIPYDASPPCPASAFLHCLRHRSAEVVQ